MNWRLFELKNVSSPFTVKGSDLDLELYLLPVIHKALIVLLSGLGIGKMKRAGVYRVELSTMVEIFLLEFNTNDVITLALRDKLQIMKSWTQEQASEYLQAKEAIASYKGAERKDKKAELARAFGLNDCVYTMTK